MNDPMQSARALCSFLYTFTSLLEGQLIACRQLSREAVDGVMRGITEISVRTADERRKANEVLVRTYSNPDFETQGVLSSAQDSVDDIFEAAQAGSLHVTTPSESRVSTGVEDTLRRSLGLFSKHMEALELLDDKLQSQLMDMMGVLSRDDVVAQRTDHTIAALTGLRTVLGKILENFEAHFAPESVDGHINEVLSTAWKTYTTQEEKKLFKSLFPGAPLKKAS